MCGNLYFLDCVLSVSSTENLLEMQIFRPHLKATKPATLGVSFSNLDLKASQVIQIHIKAKEIALGICAFHLFSSLLRKRLQLFSYILLAPESCLLFIAGVCIFFSLLVKLSEGLSVLLVFSKDVLYYFFIFYLIDSFSYYFHSSTVFRFILMTCSSC